MDSKIVTPCISVCRTDPVSGHCYGCGRNNEEKKNLETRRNLKSMEKR